MKASAKSPDFPQKLGRNSKILRFDMGCDKAVRSISCDFSLVKFQFDPRFMFMYVVSFLIFVFNLF